MAIRPVFVLAIVLGCAEGSTPTPAAPGVRAGDGAAGAASLTGTQAGAGRALPGAGGQASAGALSSSGVCGFSAPVTYGAAAADGLVDVPPNDPNIFYVGRVDCQPQGPAFAFPAVSVRVRFTGSALDLRLQDSGTGGAQSTNYYDVSIDGGAPTRLDVMGGDHVYALARDLSEGEHSAEIVKRSESNGNSGKGQLLGLRIREGAALLPVAPKPLRVEFIGDSITCGYGAEVSTTTPDMFHFTTINSNANAAYGAVAARELNAEYVAVAISGRGVYRNYSGAAGKLAPVYFEDSLPDDASAPRWDFTRYVPDVVVVNLGTNDFSPPGPDHAAYTTAYRDFLQQIRAHYPDARLLAVVGPMLNDGFPAGVNAWTTNQSDVSGVVSELEAQGDTKVHYLALTPQSPPYGEDYHPTLATHRQMAQAVVSEIRRLLPPE